MIWKYIKEIFCGKEYPLWAHGLICNICKSSFGSAKLHYENVIAVGTYEQHKDKIPVLNADKK